MPVPAGNERVDEGDIFEEIRENPDTRRMGKVGDAKNYQPDDGDDEKKAHKDKAQHHEIPCDTTKTRRPHLVAGKEKGDGEECQCTENSPELGALINPDVNSLI